jgi:prepilin-type N-terminal cleavage/methylation domain-containing protein
MVRMHRQLAFTMVELLVVIAIMAILASMIIVGAQAIMGNAQKKKTETIIQTVRQGIELAIANRSAISPTEHPFAGSRADAGGGRFPFRRNDGSAVSTAGLAYKGVSDVNRLIAQQDRLLLPNDRFADERIPLLYGALRENIGVLQSLRKVVTKYRLLPNPPKPPTGTPLSQWKVISPVTGKYSGVTYDDAIKDTNHAFFPNTLIPTNNQDNNLDSTGNPVKPKYGELGDSKLALDYLFGNSNVQAELASLKAIFNADPNLPDHVNTYKTGIESRSVGDTSEALVYTNYGSPNQTDDKTTKNQYEPGYIPVNSVGTGKIVPVSATVSLGAVDSGRWVKYRLAGLAVYDGWGNELMTVPGENNSYRVISAGLDGVFAVNPGKNLEFDTELTGNLQTLNISGDDLDGEKDNAK